jgi:hypothetical protein
MKIGQKGIYYLSAPSREFALSSPYYESFKKTDTEVIFLYQHIDDFVMKNLDEYSKRKLLSIENAGGITVHTFLCSIPPLYSDYVLPTVEEDTKKDDSKQDKEAKEKSSAEESMRCYPHLHRLIPTSTCPHIPLTLL